MPPSATNLRGFFAGARRRVRSWSTRQKAVVAAGAIAASAVAVPFAVQAKAHDIPDLGIMSADMAELRDGYNHYVVDASPVQATDEGAPATAGSDTTRVEVPLVDGQVPVGELERLAADADIVAIETLDAHTAVAVIATGDEGAGNATGPDVDRIAQRLAAVPGTKKVDKITDGTYAVTTTSPLASYRQVAGVLSVVEDVPMAIVASPDDPYYGYQYHLRNTGQTIDGGVAGVTGADVDAETAWLGGDARGQVVAVIDTGMDTAHADLNGSIWSNPAERCSNDVDDDGNGYVDDCQGYDIVNGDPTVNDSGVIGGVTVNNSHATHIAGIVAARTGNGNGVAGLARGAELMPIKVSNGGAMWMSNVTRAVHYATANGATVISMSLTSNAGTTAPQMATLQTAIDAARAKGIVVVAAAGNDSTDIDASPRFPASFANDNIISVAASNSRDEQAGFSNWGRVSVDIHAPGSTIVSLLPGGRVGAMSGTSMATPIVAAAAALHQARHPGATYQETRAALLASPDQPSSLAGRTATGRRLDIGSVLAGSTPYTFAGFAGAVEGATLNGTITAQLPADVTDGGTEVLYRASLLTAEDEAVYGVVGHPVSTGAGAQETGDDAAVDLSAPVAAGTPTPMSFSTALPAGDYAVVVDAIRASDGTAVGESWVVYFAVTVPGAPTPPPAVAPTTKTPTSSTTARPGSPTTTVAPDNGTGPRPTTTAPRTATTTRTGSPSTTVAPNRGTTPAPTSPGPVAPTPTTAAPAPTVPSAGGTPKPTTTGPRPPASTPVTPTPTTPRGIMTTTTRRQPAPAVTSTTAGPPPTVRTTPPVTAPPLPPPAAPEQSGNLRVDSINPRYGTTRGGDHVDIAGSGFRGTVHVRFDDLPAASVTVVSATLLRVRTPGHIAGMADVTVAVSGGPTVTLADAFQFRAPDPATGTVPKPGAPLPTTTTTVRSGSNPPPTTATTPPTGDDDPTPTTPPVSGPKRIEFGAGTTTARGLNLRSVADPAGLAAPGSWGQLACRAATCPANRL